MLPTSAFRHYAKCKKFNSRQTAILALICRGSTNREISDELKLREQVVKNYLKMMFDLAGIKNRASLVADVYDSYLESEEFKSQPSRDKTSRGVTLTGV